MCLVLHPVTAWRRLLSDEKIMLSLLSPFSSSCVVFICSDVNKFWWYFSGQLVVLKRSEHKRNNVFLSGRKCQMQLFKQHNKYQQTHKLFVCYLLQNELNYSCYISQGEERKMLMCGIDRWRKM